MSEEKLKDNKSTFSERDNVEFQKNSKIATYLTIATIITGGIATLFFLIGLDFYSKSLHINKNVDLVFGVGSTLLASLAFLFGFTDIMYIIKAGILKRNNILKLIILLLSAFLLLQLSLYTYHLTKKKRSRLIRDNIPLKTRPDHSQSQ